MPSAARKGDIGSAHGCFPSSPAIEGSGGVFINGKPAMGSLCVVVLMTTLLTLLHQRTQMPYRRLPPRPLVMVVLYIAGLPFSVWMVVKQALVQAGSTVPQSTGRLLVHPSYP